MYNCKLDKAGDIITDRLVPFARALINFYTHSMKAQPIQCTFSFSVHPIVFNIHVCISFLLMFQFISAVYGTDASQPGCTFVASPCFHLLSCALQTRHLSSGISLIRLDCSTWTSASTNDPISRIGVLTPLSIKAQCLKPSILLRSNSWSEICLSQNMYLWFGGKKKHQKGNTSQNWLWFVWSEKQNSRLW